MSDFIDFPPREAIVERLRAADDSSAELLPLYEIIAERLASRTYERSASAFILIELIYDFEETHGGDLTYLLPSSVFTLTGDRDLALSALGAFNEIKDAIELQARGEVEPAPGSAPPPVSAPATPAQPPPAATGPFTPSETDVIMSQLQSAQKTLADLGLSTRVSIDMTMRRPSRQRVSRTLQEISSLRGALRRFEELLSQAELHVLEAAGVLGEGEAGPRGRHRDARLDGDD